MLVVVISQIIEAGVTVVRLVAAEHKGVWLLHMEKQRLPDDYQQFTKCRPWTSFCEQEFFTGMCQRMQDAVLFYIMDYPGVTLVSDRKLFKWTLVWYLSSQGCLRGLSLFKIVYEILKSILNFT